MLNALPRIFMGLVISFVISKPLELKIFEKDIDLIISEKMQKGKNEKKQTYYKNNTDHKDLSKKIEELGEKLKEAKEGEKKYEKEFNKQKNGEGSNKQTGIGDLAKSDWKQKEDYSKKVGQLEKEIKNLKEKKLEVEKNIDREFESNYKKELDQEKSFVKQIGIAHEISPLISWSLTLLFVVLELTPIIFKLMMERAPYDFQLYDRDEVIISRSTVYENDTKHFSKNAQQIDQEKQREIAARDESHHKDVEEYKRQREEEVAYTRQQFDQTVEERMRKESEMKQVAFENKYRAFINTNLNHEQEQLLLQNLTLKEEYIQRLEELEKLDFERQLLRQVHRKKISSQEDIEMKRVEAMRLNELSKLALDEEYQQQLLALDKEHDAKRLKIYQELLDKRIKEEAENTALELSARAVAKLSHPLDMQSIHQRQKANEKQVVPANESKRIADALIMGKYYKPGENYAEIKVLTADTIRQMQGNLLELTDQQVKELFDSDENKIITDAKLAQFKKGKDLVEAVKHYLDRSNGSGLLFNMDQAISIDQKTRKALKEKMVL